MPLPIDETMAGVQEIIKDKLALSLDAFKSSIAKDEHQGRGIMVQSVANHVGSLSLRGPQA
jgi:hypothetical protein